MARYDLGERTYEVEIGVVLRSGEISPIIVPSVKTQQWMTSLVPADREAESQKEIQRIAAIRERYRDSIVWEKARFRRWTWEEESQVRDRCMVMERGERSVSMVMLRQEMLHRLLVDWSIELERDGQVVPITYQTSELGPTILSEAYYRLIVSAPVIAPIIEGLLVELERLLYSGENEPLGE